MQTECANCGTLVDEEYIKPLIEMGHLWERISPGEECPVGECLECGAVVHYVHIHHVKKGDSMTKKEARRLLIHAARTFRGALHVCADGAGLLRSVQQRHIDDVTQLICHLKQLDKIDKRNDGGP